MPLPAFLATALANPAVQQALIHGGTAAVGGLASYLGSQNPEKTSQVSRFNPQQQQLQNIAGQRGLSMLQNRQPFNYNQLENTVRGNFLSKTLPSIAERFAGVSPGRSSSFQSALQSGGTNLENILAQLHLQGQSQEDDFMHKLFGYGLEPSADTYYTPESAGGMQRFGGQLASGGLRNLLKVPQMYAQQQQQEEFIAALKDIFAQSKDKSQQVNQGQQLGGSTV